MSPPLNPYILPRPGSLHLTSCSRSQAAVYGALALPERMIAPHSVTISFLTPSMILLTLASSVMGGWLLCASALLGIGAIALRCLRLRMIPINAFWLGLAASASILEVYHLVRPVDSAIGLSLLVFGIAGLASNRALVGALLGDLRRLDRASIVLLLAILAVLAVRSSGPCNHYDTGLYGAATVRWLVSYPALPGLANLHGRFGFNSALFPVVAVLQHGFLAPLTFRIIAGLLVFASACLIVAPCVRLLRRESNSPSDWFAAVLLIPLAFWILRGDLVGTNTDLPASILSLFAIHYIFRAFNFETALIDTTSTTSDLLVAVALLSLAVTFKLSTAVLATIAWGLILYQLRSLHLPSSDNKHAYKCALVIPLLVLTPWIAHGLILSGYPAYPSSVLGIPVDWRVPVESVNLVKAGVRAWARAPFSSLEAATGFHWFRGWFHQARADRQGFALPLLIAALGCFSIVATSRHAQTRFSAARCAPLFPVVIGLASWFYFAPALRFGEGLLWGLAAMVGALGLHAIFNAKQFSRTPYVAIACLCALAMLSVYPRTLWIMSLKPALTTQQYSPFPQLDVTSVRNSSGVVIDIPRIGNQCWDAPLPCSPYLNPSLRFRRPGDLRSGFASDGLPPNAEWISSPTR